MGQSIMDWPYRRRIPADIWHSLESRQWPGWDNRGQGYPICVVLGYVQSRGTSPTEIAKQLDELCVGMFHLETSRADGKEYVEQDGDLCQAHFYFQLQTDIAKLEQVLRGSGNAG